jgi:T-complex protein 1 subunit zeta
VPRRQGFDIAKKAALEFAAELKVPVKMTDGMPERDIVLQVARTALRTKLHTQLADQVRGRRAGGAAPGAEARS